MIDPVSVMISSHEITLSILTSLSSTDANYASTMRREERQLQRLVRTRPTTLQGALSLALYVARLEESKHASEAGYVAPQALCTLARCLEGMCDPVGDASEI